MTSLKKKTIEDFGEQWTHFTANEGYYGSKNLLEDILGPHLPTSELKDKTVAEIGSGTGRIINMLMEAGCGKAYAIEPSAAFDVLKVNTRSWADRVELLRVAGDEMPTDLNLDIVFSIGVIHHIPEPLPVLKNAFKAIKPGGKLLIWVYGREGNGFYLAIFGPLRALTTRLPHSVLLGFCWLLYPFLAAYIGACRILPLPMKDYMLNHLGKLSRENQILTMYDQLNPACAHYYGKEEVTQLVESAGFTDVKLFHRHGYSWTVLATRPHE